MITTNKLTQTIILGAAASLLVAFAASQAVAADSHAKYDTMADMGVITQMPGKTAQKAEPRKVNHSRYEVLADKGIFIQPKSNKLSAVELAKKRNHAEYDAQNDIDG